MKYWQVWLICIVLLVFVTMLHKMLLVLTCFSMLHVTSQQQAQ